MKNSEDLFISTTEAAKLLGISGVAVFHKIKKGIIKAQKVGRNYLIPQKEIESMLGKNIFPVSSSKPGDEKLFSEFKKLEKKILSNPKHSISLREAKEIFLSHEELFNTDIDLGGRDIIIGFNEPAFKKSEENSEPDLDSPVNARLLSYFLPAVLLAKMQKERPRLILVSGINAALKWNANTDNERRRMMINNALKMRFITDALQTFFPDAFSLVETRASYDFLKISERKLEMLWNIFEKEYPDKIAGLKTHLLRFKKPKLFAEDLSEKDIEKLVNLNQAELKDAFKYAMVHLFCLGDINLSYDFAHNPKGYCSVGEYNEAIFNVVRKIGYEILKNVGEAVFDQEVYCFNNSKIVLQDEVKSPPPYNGAFRATRGITSLDEATFENGRPLSYYDERPRLKPSMDFFYKIIPKETFEKYWDSYKKKYLDLKARYEEAYQMEK